MPSGPGPAAVDPEVRRTVRLDALRSVPGGYMEACIASLFLLIALKRLDAGPGAKSMIAAAANAGMVLTPTVLRLAQKTRRPAMFTASVLLWVGAAALLVAGTVGGLMPYLVGTSIGMGCFNCVVPLITTVYQDRYPASSRGRLVSSAVMVRIALSALYAYLIGRWLDGHLDSYRWVVLGGAVAMAWSALIVSRFHSPVIPDDRKRSIRSSLALMRHDRTLAITMSSWMFMGMANLMMVPLRTEYLGNPRYGIDARPSQVALLVVAVPSVARVLSSALFGRIFDRMNFFGTRMVVNAAFGLSILAFFTGTSWSGLVLGAVLFGIGQGGGDILWNLWATKLAPEGQVADYMALHTFFTGVRGALAPFTAYWLVTQLSVSVVGFVCTALIAVATMVMIPELRDSRAAAAAAAAAAID